MKEKIAGKDMEAEVVEVVEVVEEAGVVEAAEALPRLLVIPVERMVTKAMSALTRKRIQQGRQC